MGGKSSSRPRETRLSREQASILKMREEQYQQFFFPELLSDIESTAGGFNAQLVADTSNRLSTSLQQGQAALNANLAQRGIANSGIGSLLQQRFQTDAAVARTSLVSGAIRQNQNRRQQLLQTAIGASPQPTTAAPIGTRSKSKQGIGQAIGAGLSIAAPV